MAKKKGRKKGNKFPKKGDVCKRKKTITDVNGKRRKVCTFFGKPTTAAEKNRARENARKRRKK